MGQTLSEPVTTKETSAGLDAQLAYGASAMQGWRISMEDAHTTILTLPSTTGEVDLKKNSFFAVFDGHGGSAVAKYAGKQLHHKLISSQPFKEGDYQKALRETYMAIDVDMRNDPYYTKETAGCTAVSALFTHDWRVIVANSGDSRAVLSANGVAVPLSFDHKPTDPVELNRIKNAGGFVDLGRVNGNLALSRALGDFEFKQNTSLTAEEQAVTANPDIIERRLLDSDEFVIVACDGIWDVLTNQDAVNFVSSRIAAGLDLPGVCEAIMDECLSTSGAMSLGCDNMTVIIIALLKGTPQTAWASRVKDRFQASFPGGISPGSEAAMTSPSSSSSSPSRGPVAGDLNGGEGVN